MANNRSIMKNLKGAYPITVTNDVTPQEIADQMVTAIESGDSSWLGEIQLRQPIKAELLGRDAWYSRPELYELDDFQIVIHHDDPDTGDDGDYSKATVVDRKMIQEGLQHMANEFPTHWGDWKSGNSDAITADVFLQCVLFKDVIYG